MTNISTEEKQIIEDGHKMISDSLNNQYDASKTLMEISFTLIPIMTALYELNLKNSKENSLSRILMVISLVLSFSTGVLFLLAFLPKKMKIDLRIPKTIIEAKNKIYNIRRIEMNIALIPFVASLIISLIAFFVKT